MFEEGQISELGSHDSLIEKKGLYYNLVTAQTSSSIDEAVELFQFERQLSAKSRNEPQSDAVLSPLFERQQSKLSKVIEGENEEEEEEEEAKKIKDLSEKEVSSMSDLMEIGICLLTTPLLYHYTTTIPLHHYYTTLLFLYPPVGGI